MTENNIDMPLDMKVGEILRNARTLGRRKREISTISKQLCIKEEFLQALEDGNYKVIPETVYILGFARNYAVELGLDPDEIVNRIKKELGLLSDCEDEEKTGIMGGACAVPGNDITEKKSNKKDFLTKIYKFIHKNWLWFTIGIAVFVIAIIALVIFLPKTSNESIETSTEVVQVSEVLEPKYRVNSCSDCKNCFENFICLDREGNLYSCNRNYGIEEFFYGNINKVSLNDVYNKIDYLKKERIKYLNNSKCKKCAIFEYCYGGCPSCAYNIHNTYLYPEDYFCYSKIEIRNYILKKLQNNGDLEYYQQKLKQIKL